MSTVRRICTIKPLLNAPIRYEYESIYVLIMFFVDKSKHYHYSYTIKQIKLFYVLSQSIGRKKHKIIELSHEKMCVVSYANNKGADQPAHPRSLISAFVVRCL